VLPYGDRALLVELGDTESVVAWVDALDADRPAGVADVVPAAETVLVVATEHADLAALRASLERIEPGPFVAAGGRTHQVEIPVRYDGPDLADVARLTGLGEHEVVARHAAADYVVAFCGFAPGFGYLVGEDERLRVPRRSQPRTTVPAGSVGLADAFSGVYPRSGPGGWQLIGSTDVAMWDIDRDPPALLQPGGRVRFTAR
jgi:KipI family sensor histidine kinase inhibitor